MVDFYRVDVWRTTDNLSTYLFGLGAFRKRQVVTGFSLRSFQLGLEPYVSRSHRRDTGCYDAECLLEAFLLALSLRLQNREVIRSPVYTCETIIYWKELVVTNESSEQ